MTTTVTDPRTSALFVETKQEGGVFSPGLRWSLDAGGDLVGRLQIASGGTPWQRTLGAGELNPRRWCEAAELDLFRALVRIAAHDYRGKQMGVMGILEEWKTLWPERQAGHEDLALVMDALHHASDALCPLEWLVGRAAGDGFGWDPHALDRRWAYVVPRLFSVPSQVKWKSVESGSGAACSLGLPLFWMGTLAMALGAVKDPKQVLGVGARFEHRSDVGDVLVVILDSDGIWERLVGEVGGGVEVVQRWLSLAALAGTTVEVREGGGLCLVIPMVDGGHCLKEMDLRAEPWTEERGGDELGAQSRKILGQISSHAFGLRRVRLRPVGGAVAVGEALARIWAEVDWVLAGCME